jgi:hypothetical protein
VRLHARRSTPAASACCSLRMPHTENRRSRRRLCGGPAPTLGRPFLSKRRAIRREHTE